MSMIVLRRLEESQNGTFGVLMMPNGLWLYTLEPPPGRPQFGRIPAGEYEIYRHNGAKYTNTWGLVCPPRIGILFHAGNWAMETKGCILLGLEKTARSVLQSREAMNQFRSAMAYDPATRCRVEETY